MTSVQILIDNVEDRNGTLYEAYDFLLPRQIKVQTRLCCEPFFNRSTSAGLKQMSWRHSMTKH